MQDRVKRFFGSPLARDTLFYGTAKMAERAISFLIIPLLTKTLPQEMYAVWSQIVITLGLLSPIVLIGFPTAIVRFLAAREDRTETSSLFHGLLCVVLANTLLVLVISFGFATPVSQLMFDDAQFADFVRLFGFLLLAEALFELVIAFLRAFGEIRTISIYLFLQGLARIAVLGLAILVLRLDLYHALILSAVAQFLLAGYVYVKNVLARVGVRLVLQDVPWRTVMLFSLPLIPYAIATWANNFVDRFLILHVIGINAVGVYAVAFSLSQIMTVFYIVMGYTLYPHMSRLWNSGDRQGAARYLDKSTQAFIFFVALAVPLLTILSPYLVRVISTTQYLAGWPVFLCLNLGVVAFGLYSLHLYALLLADRTTLCFVMMVVALVANVLLNLLLIPAWGINGAAVATLLSNTILVVWTVAKSHTLLPYRFPWSSFVQSVVIAAGVTGLLLVLQSRTRGWDDLWVLVVLSAIAVVVYSGLQLLYKRPSFLRLGGTP
jgi:O-antigen/teichoic acid export membrane protein